MDNRERMKMAAGSAVLALIGSLVLALPVHAAGGAGKTSIEEVEQEASELVEALRDYGADRRDAVIEKAAGTLAALDRRIDALETRIDEGWDRMDRAARERARESLRALREQRVRVAEWYGGLKRGSENAWGHARKGFSDAFGELREAWRKSEREFGSGQ